MCARKMVSYYYMWHVTGYYAHFVGEISPQASRLHAPHNQHPAGCSPGCLLTLGAYSCLADSTPPCKNCVRTHSAGANGRTWPCLFAVNEGTHVLHEERSGCPVEMQSMFKAQAGYHAHAARVLCCTSKPENLSTIQWEARQ